MVLTFVVAAPAQGHLVITGESFIQDIVLISHEPNSVWVVRGGFEDN